MPVVGVPIRDLSRRIGRELEQEKLLEMLGDLGCDVEGLAVLQRVQCTQCGYVMELAGKEEVPLACDQCQAELRGRDDATRRLEPIEVVRMELLAVRPDMFDPAGLARALRGWLGEEIGRPEYPVGDPAARLRVDPSVRRPSSLRPHIACAIVDGVAFDDDSIKVLMKLQENLHWALGRNRKHASIGVYDLGSLEETREFEYATEDPSQYAFVPLGVQDTRSQSRQTLATILATHPKGRMFAHLLAGFDRYPILRSKAGEVLSMPPIINSESTRVRKETTRLFIDVTGSGARVVQRTLNILVTSLLDYHPDARLHAVEVEGATRPESANGTSEDLETVTLRTPDLTPQPVTIDALRTQRLLGFETPPERLRELLERMRHEITGVQGSELRVAVAAYRNDILHERDLMEDAAIAYGYRNIVPSLVPSMTVGRDLPSTRQADCVRDVLSGLGFLEIMALTLTCAEQSDELLGLPPHPETVLLANPISNEQTQLRTSLLPGLLGTFARNRHNSLPQDIFEVGEVTFVDPEADTGARERIQAAFAQIATKTGFAEIRALAQAITRDLGWPFDLAPVDAPFFLPGRAAAVRAPSGSVAGVFGEIHPAVLERLGLQNPVVCGELDIESEPFRLRSFPSFLSRGTTGS